MGTYKKITRNQPREFLLNVEVHQIPDAKQIIKENNERYCFGLRKAAVTYYPTTETLLIQGSEDIAQSYTSAIEQIIQANTVNRQINICPYLISNTTNSEFASVTPARY